jgi:hypothetical protein
MFSEFETYRVNPEVAKPPNIDIFGGWCAVRVSNPGPAD